MKTFFGTTRAFVHRDFFIATSYKFHLLFQLTAGFFLVTTFYFIAQLIDSQKFAGKLEGLGVDYFSYVVIGVAATGFLHTGLSGFTERIRTAMTEGSLEMMFSCPTRPAWIMTLPCIWGFFFEALKATLVVAFAVVVFGAKLHAVNLLSCLVILLLTITSYSVFGLLSVSIVTVVKRGDPINWAFSAASSLIAGAYFPIESLPPYLAAIARYLPMTYTYRGLRASLLHGSVLSQVWPEIQFLAAFSFIGLPFALAATSFAVAKAKRDGTLGAF
ncbi:MAG: ABC transporter permease [Planctomycetota bacterium]